MHARFVYTCVVRPATFDYIRDTSTCVSGENLNSSSRAKEIPKVAGKYNNKAVDYTWLFRNDRLGTSHCM